MDNNRLDEFLNSNQNIRPDFVFHVLKRHDDILTTQTIYDVKNIFNYGVYYTHPDRGFAVNRKVRDCKTLYVKHARVLDRRFNNTPAGSRGPIESRLDALGGIVPLCFGRFGEVNQAVIDLIDACALAKARHIACNRPRYQRDNMEHMDNGVDVNRWRALFRDTYLRVLSISVGYFKAGLIIGRKSLIGLKPNEQSMRSGSHPSLVKLFAGFKRDHFGPDKGSHVYDTDSNMRPQSSSPFH